MIQVSAPALFALPVLAFLLGMVVTMLAFTYLEGRNRG